MADNSSNITAIDTTDVEQGGRKYKRKTYPERVDGWARTKNKKARVEGKEFVNYKGVVKPAREWKDVKCVCNCSKLMSFEEKAENYKQFCGLSTHELQNSHLKGCTLLDAIKTLKNGKKRSKFSHIIRLSNRTIGVCQRFFLGLHGIQRSRLRTKILIPLSNIVDLRGKHGNHPRVKDEVVAEIRDFLSDLPARESHYSRNKNPNRKYLASNLSIASLHRQFLGEHEHVSPLDCSYYSFHKIFRRDFNLAFGCPRSDICAKCERLNAELLILQNPAPGKSKQEIEIAEKKKEIDSHKDDCELFYQAIRDIKELGEEHCGLCFDYEQNLPLPVTSTNKEFYSRQLWVQNFGVHDMKSGKACMFVYSEHFAQKGANEVISCLNWYINNKVPAKTKYLYLCCDNCGGQNKNRYLFGFFQHLADTRFEKVTVFYPEPGHSRMPIDSDHAKIEIYKRKFDKIALPSRYIQIIQEAQHSNPFDICYVQRNFTDDLTSDGRPVIDVLNFKNSLEPVLAEAKGGIRVIRNMTFKSNQNPVVNSPSPLLPERSKGKGKPMQLFRDAYNSHDLSNAFTNAKRAYDNFLPITKSKFQDIQALLVFAPPPHGAIFYDTLYYQQESETPTDEANTESTPEVLTIDISYDSKPKAKSVCDTGAKKCSHTKAKIVSDSKARKVSHTKAKSVSDSKGKKVSDSKATKVSHTKAKKVSDSKATNVSQTKAKNVSAPKVKKATDIKTKTVSAPKVKKAPEAMPKKVSAPKVKNSSDTKAKKLSDTNLKSHDA